MRKIFIMLCLATTNSAGQNVLNAYNNSLNDPNDYDFENLNSNYLNNFIYSIPPGSGYYRGEFEIYFGRLPWYQLFIDPVVALGASSSTAVPYVYSMSYFYEVVTFPFHKECAYVGTGDCTEQTPCSTQVRNMNLPVEDQNPIRPRLKSSTCVRDEDICGSITGVNHLLIYRAQRYLSDVDEWG